MAGRIQHLYIFKHFYDQLDFSSEQRLAITKSIVELTDPTKSCDLVEGRTRRKGRFDDNAAVFYVDDERGLPTNHNRPLYVIANVNGVELRRAMLDPGSSINIISLSTLDAVGVPRDNIIRQPIEVSSFRGHKTYTFGFGNLDLVIASIRAAHPFQVIDSQSTAHYFR